MKRTVLAAAILMMANGGVVAQSLNDQSILGSNQSFSQRVRESIIGASINIAADGLTNTLAAKRHSQAQQILNAPGGWSAPFANAIATQAPVINAATATGTVGLTVSNTDAQQALISDNAINTAVASVYNAFFGGQ